MRDVLNTYSDAQAITDTGAANSTNVIDQLAAGDAIANTPYLRVKVNTAFTSDGAGTLAVSLLTSDAEDFGSGVTTVPLVDTTAKTALTAGAVLYQGRLPFGMKRYSKLVYTVGTAAMTAGKVDAFLTEMVATNKM